jgi:hypothetical protein
MPNGATTGLRAESFCGGQYLCFPLVDVTGRKLLQVDGMPFLILRSDILPRYYARSVMDAARLIDSITH